MDTKATVELYKTEYTRIGILPELTQNQNAPAAVNPVIVTPDPDSYGTNSGAAIHSARFADTDTAARFSLRVVAGPTNRRSSTGEFQTMSR